MKTIKHIFKIVTFVNPYITRMPILMVLFSFLGLWISFTGSEAMKNTIYIFLNSLFFIIPMTTIFFVFKYFKKRKRNNILKRKIITITPGIIGILLYQTDIKNIYLLIISGIGFLYFLIDFIKQTDLAFKIIKKPKTSLKNEKVLFNTLATKCSRTVFFESLKYLKNKETKKHFEIKARKYNFHWLHLFPLTERSLTENILKIKF